MNLNIMLPYDPNTQTPQYVPNWVENLCLHKNLHINVYSNFIHSCQNLRGKKGILQ